MEQIDDLFKSNSGEMGRETVFYYNRENRLSRAPQKVRDLYEEKPRPRRGLFSSLTATRPLKSLFVSTITVAVMVMVFSILYGPGNSITLDNNKIKAQAVASGGNTYVTLDKTALSDNAYTGAVNVAISTGKDSVYAERIYFNPVPEEAFRFIAPFSGKNCSILLESDEHRALLKIKSE